MPLTKDDFQDIFHAHTVIAEVDGQRRVVLPDYYFKIVTELLLKRLLDHFNNSVQLS